jgi:purine nucleosidase
MRRFVIDTDTASDDAVALVMAVRHPDVQIEAITVVAGNVPLAQGVQNARYTLDQCGVDIPVYAGAAQPLLRPLETAQDTHGMDGMGDIGLPLHGYTSAPGHAVDVLIDTITQHAGDITLVTLGPLTNVALALRRDPSLAQKVSRCVMMGGVGYGYGNVTPVAEYNIWVDPEAAQIVFGSGMLLTMVGWDISREYAVFEPDDVAAVRALGTPLAAFCMDIQRAVQAFALHITQLSGFDLPDPLAMAVALDPTIAETRRMRVDVVAGGLCRGQTVVDHLGITGRTPNVDVVTRADREAFVAMLHAACSA